MEPEGSLPPVVPEENQGTMMVANDSPGIRTSISRIHIVTSTGSVINLFKIRKHVRPLRVTVAATTFLIQHPREPGSVTLKLVAILSSETSEHSSTTLLRNQKEDQ
jgi:hypothetical protein